MHILIAGLYAFVAWISILLYTAMLSGGFWIALLSGPLAISALIAMMIAGEWLIVWVIRPKSR